MWRVSHIYIVPSAGEPDVPLPCVHFTGKLRRKLYNLTVRLEDDAGNAAVLEGYEWRTAGLSRRFLTWEALSEELKNYNPYGYVPGSTGGENFILSAVDDVSYKFLDYVDRIVPVKFDQYTKYANLNSAYGFVFVDNLKSLVDINPMRSIKRAFPLFQATCFAPDGWREDGYYMWNTQGSTLYRAEFTDMHEARAFVGKQTMRKYGNPMIKGIGVIRSHADILG